MAVFGRRLIGHKVTCIVQELLVVRAILSNTILEIVSKQRFEAKQRLFAHLTMNVVLCFGQKAPLYDFLGGNTGDAASNYFNVI